MSTLTDILTDIYLNIDTYVAFAPDSDEATDWDAPELSTEEWTAQYGETAEERRAAIEADEAREDARLARERQLEAEWEAWLEEHPEYDPTDDEPI